MMRLIKILSLVAFLGWNVAVVSGTPINGDFESGTLTGWQLQIPSGQTMAQSSPRPAGSARVTQAWTAGNTLRAALQGNEFALLGTLADGNFIQPRSYQLTLRQDITLLSGDQISGWAFFFNGDYVAQDSAWVKILDAQGTMLVTPWQERSGSNSQRDGNSVSPGQATPWTEWSWRAPQDGNYTLLLGMSTRDDNNNASYGGFDAIIRTAAAAVVPEPSALSILALSAAITRISRKQKLGAQT